jgi:serine/threonine-protein kinase
MLYELTTGKRLFKGQGDYETLKLICDRDYPRPSQIREGYPEELERIVMRALEKDRDKRYQSAREMQQAIEDFARRERIPVSPIALNQFMGSLFAEKLASQSEALQQGKQLADIIEVRNADSMVPDDMQLSQSVLSAPAASRTIAEMEARKSWRGIALGLTGVAFLAGALVGTRSNVLRRDVAPPPPPPPAVVAPPPQPPVVVTLPPAATTATTTPPESARDAGAADASTGHPPRRR